MRAASEQRLRQEDLLEGVKHPERDFLVGPEICCVAEYVKQGFPSFFIEFWRIRQLFQHHQEAGLRTCLMGQAGQAV